MNIEEKKSERILKFVLSRKRPITAAVVAQQFAISQSTAAKHLRSLHIAGRLTKTQSGKKVLWAEDTTSMPVALPREDFIERTPEPELIVVQPRRPAPIEPAKPIWPDNPFNKTSYPHIRGYDD